MAQLNSDFLYFGDFCTQKPIIFIIFVDDTKNVN